MFPYNFSQNGLVAYKNGELLEIQTISKHLGEDNVKRIVNWVMKYLADLDLPIKVRRISLVFVVCSQTQLSALAPCCFKFLTFFIPYQPTQTKNDVSEERSSSFAVECSIFPPLVATALAKNETLMKNMIWNTTFAKTWLRP